MCIIISKDRNCDRLPTIGELTNCFEYNRDGAGFMYVENGSVVIEKGFMKLDKFLNHFDELCQKFNNFKKKALVIHCRIGTSSGNTPENTHPYAVTTKEKNLHKLYFKTDLGVVHNGIINAYTPKNRNSSVNDTQKFILEYLAPIHKHFKNFYKMEKFRDGIKSITNSKFVFLDNNERTYYVGDFIDENGLKFSNTTYKSFLSYSNHYTKYDSYFDDNYKYFDDDYETDTESNYNYYDYFDIEKNLIYLQPSWFYWCEDTNTYENVSDYEFDMVYSLDDASLYILDELGELIPLANNVRVYDEDFKSIL